MASPARKSSEEVKVGLDLNELKLTPGEPVTPKPIQVEAEFGGLTNREIGGLMGVSEDGPERVRWG
jgi:hypothetical protein